MPLVSRNHPMVLMSRDTSPQNVKGGNRTKWSSRLVGWRRIGWGILFLFLAGLAQAAGEWQLAAGLGKSFLA